MGYGVVRIDWDEYSDLGRNTVQFKLGGIVGN